MIDPRRRSKTCRHPIRKCGEDLVRQTAGKWGREVGERDWPAGGGERASMASRALAGEYDSRDDTGTGRLVYRRNCWMPSEEVAAARAADGHPPPRYDD